MVYYTDIFEVVNTFFSEFSIFSEFFSLSIKSTVFRRVFPCVLSYYMQFCFRFSVCSRLCSLCPPLLLCLCVHLCVSVCCAVPLCVLPLFRFGICAASVLCVLSPLFQFGLFLILCTSPNLLRTQEARLCCSFCAGTDPTRWGECVPPVPQLVTPSPTPKTKKTLYENFRKNFSRPIDNGINPNYNVCNDTERRVSTDVS